VRTILRLGLNVPGVYAEVSEGVERVVSGRVPEVPSAVAETVLGRAAAGPAGPYLPIGAFKQRYIQRPPLDVRPADSGRSARGRPAPACRSAASAGPPRLGASGRLRPRRRHRLAGYATFCILFAKSRPDVGGGSALPSLE